MRAHKLTFYFFDGWTSTCRVCGASLLASKARRPLAARLAKTGRKTRKNVIYGHTNELITWRCRGLSYCKPTASTALSIACSSSITIKRDVLLRGHTAPDPVRLVIAYQHLFQHSSLGPWRGIVIYQTLLPLSRMRLRACAYIL